MLVCSKALSVACHPKVQTAWITKNKAIHHKKPSAEINLQALVVSFEEAGNPFKDDGRCLFALDSKVIVGTAAMTAVRSVITSGIQQYNNFVEERLEKRTKPVKKPLRKNKLHVFV